jgi:hypothetical protein
MKISPALLILLESHRHTLPHLKNTSRFKHPGYKPKFDDLELVYKTYYKGQDLTKYSSECAVRLSIALSLNDFSFDRFEDKSRVKRGIQGRSAIAFVAGAEELARYLKSEWGAPTFTFKKHGRDMAARVLSGKRGVVYFNNCCKRSKDGPGIKNGDHIDIWNGSKYYNKIMKIGAQSKHDDGSDLFKTSSSVWFWEIF